MTKMTNHNTTQGKLTNLNQMEESFTFEKVARYFNMTQEQLKRMLREEGILDEYNRPYSEYVEKGYFNVAGQFSKTVTTLLSKFSMMVNHLSPGDLQSVVKVINSSTPKFQRRKLLRTVFENLLIVTHKSAKKQIKEIAEVHKAIEPLTTYWNMEIEQGREDFPKNHIIMEGVQEIKGSFFKAEHQLALIGELINALLILFETVASDQDYAILMGIRVQDIIDARAWFTANILDGDGEYEPSFGDLVYPLGMVVNDASERLAPFCKAIKKAETFDLLEHSKYLGAINILKKMVME